MPADNVKSLYIFLKAVKRKLLLLARYLTVYKVAAKARDYIAMETKTNKQTNKSNERKESERGVARKGFLILLINFYFLSI